MNPKAIIRKGKNEIKEKIERSRIKCHPSYMEFMDLHPFQCYKKGYDIAS